MYDMLKNMDPPLGFGNKCPNRLAYKKLIRMNMPVDVDGKVGFTNTLFALIRENLSIKLRPGKSFCVQTKWSSTYVICSAEEMDQADDELRDTIKMIWPLQAKNMVHLLVPPNDQVNTGKLTVGKIYAGLLILESWRSTRFGQMEPTGIPVRITFLIYTFQWQTLHLKLISINRVKTWVTKENVSHTRVLAMFLYKCVYSTSNQCCSSCDHGHGTLGMIEWCFWKNRILI